MMEKIDQISVNFLLFASGITGRSLSSGRSFRIIDGRFLIGFIFQSFITSVQILTERTATVINLQRPSKQPLVNINGEMEIYNSMEGVKCQRGDVWSLRKLSNLLLNYINIDRGSNLTYTDKGYCFGKITKGMSIVDSITKKDVIQNSGLILTL